MSVCVPQTANNDMFYEDAMRPHFNGVMM